MSGTCISHQPSRAGRTGIASFASVRGRFVHLAFCLAGLACVLIVGTPLDAHRIPAGGNLVEAGSPPFVILGAETLGLDAPPTDIRELPDGRLLVMAPRQIALGDGVRWQVFHQAPDDRTAGGLHAAVAPDGEIYVAAPHGGAHMVFGEDGFWRLEVIAPWPPGESGELSLPQAMVHDLGATWIWHSLTGALVSWKPGDAPRLLPSANVVENAFTFGGDLYLSERFNGRLSRIQPGASEVVLEPSTLASITCTVPLTNDTLLTGSYGLGLQVFDGRSIRPFTPAAAFSDGARINDLCATHGGFFAAAVDNRGIIFFTREGHPVQLLDRTTDSRLTRVKRLLRASDGAIWGLLESGLVRVTFPSPVSQFEPLIGPGVTTAHPCRVDGRLWLLADGRIYRARYDADDRLDHFELDSPPQVFVNSFSDAPGILIAGTEHGVWFKSESESGWINFAPDIANLRILDPAPVDDRWLYAAHGEIGWLRRTDTGLEVPERIPVPGLTNSFNHPVKDGAGRFWLELGTGRVARIHLLSGIASAEILDQRNGAPANWPQAFAYEGEMRFNMGDIIYRFDETQQRFQPDFDFASRLPGQEKIFGRAETAPDGRLWVSGDDTVRVYEKRGGTWHRSRTHVPAGFQPYYFTFEDQGVVWMHAQHRLVRYDPAMPDPETRPITARITHVTLPATRRHHFHIGEDLPAMTYAENSLIAHFNATGNNFASPVTFEVWLEGAGANWVGAGGSGSAVFNDLKEGAYTLHVRPRASGVAGIADSVGFVIRPPWFRTTLAYVIYALGAVTLVMAVASGWSYLSRRERQRLERVVAERTVALRASEDRYRRLSEELEQRVNARTDELHQANERIVESYRELEAFSYSISHDLRAPLRNIRGFSDLLQRRCGTVLDAEGTRFLNLVATESTRLGQLIDSLLAFSRLNRTELRKVALDPRKLVEACRQEMHADVQGRAIEWHIDPLPTVTADPTLLHQVFANLMDNAVKFTRGRDPAIIEIGARRAGDSPGGTVFFVRDNGAGFDPRSAGKLFGVFQRLHAVSEFEGTGIGLANVQRIIQRHGGRIWAEGAVQHGATFFFFLPAEGE